MTVGYNINNSEREVVDENDNFNRYLNQAFYDCSPSNDIPDFFEYQNDDLSINLKDRKSQVFDPKETIQLFDDPLDSAWPMYCHDVRHTGRSPYSTVSNVGFDKWWFKTDIDNRGYIEGSGVIDKDGVIYFGSWWTFYAMYPNGTLKWQYRIGGEVESSPAIDKNGTIYVGIAEGWGTLFAFNTNGTLKWTYGIGEEILSSPTIGNDGTIYIGDGGNYINAINHNGTLKWKYKTGHKVYSSPAIGDDGTVYCGSHDNYLYALYPNNGTLKWRYKLEDWVRTSPCIADDGTIYVASLALHALFPNGTLKWKTNLGGSTSPTLGQDGTIYCGLFDLYALNPDDGSVKWKFDLGSGRTIQGGTPCNSVDGTIYFGTHIGDFSGGEIISVSSDGTEKWRKRIATEWVDFAPIIGEDGTIYIGSSTKEFVEPGAVISIGYLHAFNEMDPTAPTAPKITGPVNGNSKTEIDYTFKSTSPLKNDVYYYIDWGDGDWKKDWWLGPYDSGKKAVISHTWSEPGTYTIRTRCKDTGNLWSDWSEFEIKISIPRNRAWLKLIDMFPILQRVHKFIL